MASLTTTVSLVRRGTVVFLVFSVVILAGDFLLRLVEQAQTNFAAPTSPWVLPDELFGEIPAPKIKSLEINPNSEPTFAVDGDFPPITQTPTTALVYAVPRPRITLSTIDEAVTTARALGFFTEYKESQTEDGVTVLKWEREGGVRSLTYEIGNRFERWGMSTQFNFDSTAQLPKSVNTDPDFYTSRAKSIISSLGLNDQTLSDGKQIATLGKLGPDGFLTQPINPSSADYVNVQLHHQLPIALTSQAARDLELDYQDQQGTVYRNNPLSGSMGMIVSDQLADTTIDIYSLSYNRFKYNTNSYGVYSIVSPAEAWERIRRGEGSLTLLQLQPFDRFSPNRVLEVEQFTADAASVELGFFEPETWEGYIYPIYVFRGRVDTTDNKVGRFVFYVDALERLNL